MTKAKIDSLFHSTGKLLLILNVILVAVFAVFVVVKTYPLPAYDWLSYPWILGFSLLSILVVLYLTRVKEKRKWHIAPLLLILILLLFAYDFSAAEAWVDAKGDIITAQKLHTVGWTKFIAEYHRQSSHEILNSESSLKSVERYDRLIPIYDINTRLHSEDTPYTPVLQNRTQHHPPFYFSLLALWMNLSRTLLSYKILAKVLYLIYLISLFILLRYHLQDVALAISGIALVAFMPSLLYASQAPKNDMLLGIVTSWLVFFLFQFLYPKQDIETEKVRDRESVWQHIVIGLFVFLAIFSKFTALLVVLPVCALYCARYSYKAIWRLVYVALPTVIISIFLYFAWGYDIILNIISGRVVQDEWIAANTSFLQFIVQRVLFGQFRIGIPLIIMMGFTLLGTLKEKNSAFRSHQISFLFYLSIFLLLWGSSIDRHQIGFLPFAIPLLGLGLKRYKQQLGVLLIILAVYNFLFIFYSVLDNNRELLSVINSNICLTDIWPG